MIENVIWAVSSAALAVVGVAVMLRGTSRAWLIAGSAYFVGGVGSTVSAAIYLTDPYDPPIDFAAADIAAWAGLVGFLAIAAAMVATLVAVGRAGRRRFVTVFAAMTLTIGTYEFWTSNWAARTATARDRCIATGHVFGPEKPRIQRVAPGVWCPDPGGEVFVPADGICWLALAGWSIFWALLASFPVLGLGWAARRRPRLRLA
jgi:hypothetical protein